MLPPPGVVDVARRCRDAGIAVVRMEHNGLKPSNGPVIVNGATGGVGSIAIAMLAKLGYHVVALTGKESESGISLI